MLSKTVVTGSDFSITFYLKTWNGVPLSVCFYIQSLRT